MSPDGDAFAVLTRDLTPQDGLVLLVDGKLKFRLETTPREAIRDRPWIQGLTFDPSGEMIIGCGKSARGGSTAVWSRENGKLLRRLNGPVDARGVSCSSDGAWLIIGGDDGGRRTAQHAVAYSLPRLRRRRLSCKIGKPIQSIAVSPADPRLFATGHDDGTIRLWNVSQAAAVWTVAAHRRSVGAIAFTPRGDVVSGGVDQTIHLISAQGKLLRRFYGSWAPIQSLEVHPSGRSLLSCTVAGDAHVWQLPLP